MRITLIAGEPGLTVAWPSPGDRSLPPEAAGHDRLFVTHLDADMELQSSKVSIGIPLFDEYTPPLGAHLREPRGAFYVLGASRASAPAYTGVFVARFDCR